MYSNKNEKPQMKRFFVTHISPREKTFELNISLSATNFNYNLISGNMFDKTYSILPAFVSGKHKFDNSKDIEYIYSTWRYKNRFMRKIAPLIENIALYKKIEKQSSVWFYNVSTLNALTMILLMLFKKSVQVNLIILDYTPGEFLNKCFLPIINRCHGRICLSMSDLFNKDNLVSLPGVVPINGKEYKKLTTINKEFLISGALNENIASTSMLLEAFSRMPECILHITTGRPEAYKKLIEQYSIKYKNIIFHNTLNDNEFQKLLENVTYILSTRNPNSPENRCNFPSKIIEALLHNKIIISTIHYPQIDGIKYFEVAHNTDQFIQDIKKISSMKDEELLEYANQSQSVMDKFNTKVWNNAMQSIENK